ncbi:Mediator of DNA damage checkpoint protein 1 [Trachymyrmex septentrionalis]|uniref:Mediator of DNA damage checkpoint protein 1 n=1 Tax=Trachymyrmex septentrionalis TaxID=34720 RepID=A0A195FXH1_9HYME|nr:PREDICTED: probable cyclin-dependent serine/threonine-protein kinase DDB_G0292550 [Trachymyrmex septentrionalis]KYN45133.1 Mediator of DNA damage checkpoint protein 1 [Trachymyrmex septentrionalis]
MDFSATQIYEDEDNLFTDSYALTEEESVQVGTLSINSTDYQIKTGITKIGRLDICNIVIRNETVSKLHAEIEASGRGSTWICDLKSLNKTKLNNLILRPNRSYELKDGSVIEFGGVRATYRIYCPANNEVIPETPAPSRQKTANIIIPNTPDSSLNNSSSVDNDGSIIFGTQKDDEIRSVFRRPRVPQQSPSLSINKKNTSKNESNDSLSSLSLHTSDINVSENQVSIYEAETQKFDERYKTTSNSIYNMETQGDLVDTSKHVKTNAKSSKQLPKLNVCDKTADRSVTDIHNIETQNCLDNINEMETQKDNISIRNVTTDIHTMETQADNIDEDSSNAQNFEIDKGNNQEKNLTKIGCSIHDLETQKFDDNYIAKNISDLETQLELNSIVRGEQNKDISDMETQFETDGMANKISNRVNKEKDRNDIANTTKDGTNHEDITKSPRSRSKYLNLSSPRIEGKLSSSLNQSAYLLESSGLLELFSDGIDEQEVQVSNASTPKPLAKVSSKKNSNVEHVQNMVNDEENDEDIFEAPTQCASRKFEALMSDDSETDEKDVVIMSKDSKKKCGKPRSEQTNDVSETDTQENIAELAEKQCKLRTLNKPSHEVVNDRNDPGTSIESEDMFDLPTQLNNPVTNNTSNSSIDQSQNSNKINEAKISDMPTQIINNNHDNQKSTSVLDIDDVAPTQVILSRETSPSNSIDLALKNNRNDTNKRIINAESVDYRTTENLDCEDIDYELAPTQVIGEIENKGKGISTREKGSSQVNLNDTLEEKLNEMFDDVNNDMNNIQESPHMSTQYLEKILESSQSDDFINKANDNDRDTCNVPQKQTEKEQHASHNQRSHNLLDSEVNTNDVNKTESQNSDIYFSTITTKRKRNILKDTQEFPASVKDNITPSGQDTDFSQTSKASNEKAMDDNMAQESNKGKKRIAKTKHESDSITETLNDNDKNKIISSGNNKRSLRSSKLMKYDDEPASKTRKQVLENGPTKLKVDDAEEKTSICTPCPSENDGQRAQILDTLYESDDDILTRLPAVRISGTLSNPASPSASSTSTVRSTKSKRDIARSKGKASTSLKGKSLRKQDIENSGKHNKSSIDSQSNLVHNNLMTDRVAGLVDTSDESDDSSESTYKRFQQIADRMLSNEHNCSKRQKKRNKESSHVSSNMSEDPKQNTDDKSKNSWISTRITRHSSKQNNESPHDLQKETLKSIEATSYEATRSTKSETKSIIGKRKIPLNMIKKSVEQTTSKKRKTVAEECPVSTRSRRNAMKTTIDRQSPNILEHVAKIRSCENIFENIKSSEDNKAIFKTTLEETQEISLNMRSDGNVYPGRSNVKRTRQTIYNNQVVTHVNDVTTSENSKKNKPAPIKETKTQMNQQLSKVPKIILSPLKNLKSLSGDGSQEVESIMARAPSTLNKNLSIREGSKTKIFKRELRTRSKKQQNSDTETDSVLTESSLSSVIEDSDNTHLDNAVPKAKHKRSAKSSIPAETTISSLSQVSIKRKEEIFKKPSRIKNSLSSLIDTSIENMTGESSQSGTESDTSINSRSSRSKTARKKMESNQNTCRLTDESASSLNTSTETTSLLLTPSRTRRSMSILNNSISFAMKHKVLFTGITGVMENYSEIVKTLGGSKVEDPAQCTVLVTDKVRRTYKFLCALAKSAPIVAIDWLTESKIKKEFIDWEKHILKDPEAETRYDFKLRESLDKAREKKMLDGYIVVLTPNVGPPPIKELKDIISSCGGKTLLRPPTKWPERAIILSRKEDLPNAKKFLAKAPKTVTVQDIEFILTGILRQETDFVKYKLT